MLEVARLVAVQPCREREMVTSIDDIDRVELNEAKPIDQARETGGVGAAARVVEQTLGVHQQ
jgi:hypothetical protein